jgi:hypothetical protein
VIRGMAELEEAERAATRAVDSVDGVDRAPTHISELLPDPKNARRHPDRNLRQIGASLTEVGAARSIVIDEQNRILAGNGLVSAAAGQGMTRARVVDADGEEIIAVRRRGLTEEQKVRLALLDNRASELAEWDPDVLKELRTSGTDLADLWNMEELKAIEEDDGLQGAIAAALDGEIGEEESEIRDLGDRKIMLKPVLYADSIAAFESAIALTGERNRGKALMQICAEYVERHAQG